jgi:predicted transposase/invertase (TIGR01784 family)
MMGRVEIARAYIRHKLPVEITSWMDLTTLEVDTEGYVDDQLKTHFSDVVATVQLTDGQPADIYILFEHKSGPDILVRIQVLKYMVQKWFKWIKDRNLFEGYLPIVIPVVVYHGRQKWKYSQEFIDLFRLPSADFLPYVPQFRHILNDISHMDENAFRESVDVQVFLMLLKYIFHPDLNQKLPEIMSLLHELKDKDRITEYLPIIIRYILKAGKVSVDEIKKAVKSLPKGEETVETTADQLIQEGIKRGIQIGESKGELRGIQIGESKGELRGIQIGESRGIQIGESRGESRGIQVMINELLQERFDIVHPSISQKIKSIESTETLKALFRKALKIESLQEFDRTIDRVLQPL